VTTLRRAGEAPQHELVAFRPGGEFSVGVEDELLLVDHDGQLDGDSAALIAELSRHGLGASTATPEIFLSQVEFNTPVCHDAATVGSHLARCRSALSAVGQPAMAAGVHPTAQLGRFARTRSPRYDALAAEFAGLLRTPTSAFQVHVGVPDTTALLAAYRCIRNGLPVLRALSAGSPYWHGMDSGVATTRAAIIRSYPRVGFPPLLRSYGEYEAVVWEEMAAAEVDDYTLVCWEVRPHPRFGTLEVRVMDAQPSVQLATGLVALVQGLARQAVEDPPAMDLSPAVRPPTTSAPSGTGWTPASSTSVGACVRCARSPPTPSRRPGSASSTWRTPNAWTRWTPTCTGSRSTSDNDGSMLTTAWTAS
jgi:carboxylate-amine ligase